MFMDELESISKHEVPPVRTRARKEKRECPDCGYEYSVLLFGHVCPECVLDMVKDGAD